MTPFLLTFLYLAFITVALGMVYPLRFSPWAKVLIGILGPFSLLFLLGMYLSERSGLNVEESDGE